MAFDASTFVPLSAMANSDAPRVFAYRSGTDALAAALTNQDHVISSLAISHTTQIHHKVIHTNPAHHIKECIFCGIIKGVYLIPNTLLTGSVINIPEPGSSKHPQICSIPFAISSTLSS